MVFTNGTGRRRAMVSVENSGSSSTRVVAFTCDIYTAPFTKQWRASQNGCISPLSLATRKNSYPKKSTSDGVLRREREVEELVFHGVAEGGFDLHFLETRGISIHANGECQ